MTETVKTFEQLLTEWEDLKKQIAALSENEKTLRKVLFDAAFPEAKEGTNTRELIDGRKVKGVKKFNRSVDEAAVAAVLSELRKFNSVIPEQVFPISYSLSLSNYKKLTQEARTVADRAIITKPATPTLEVE
jgi:hypothetical protein